MKLNRSQSAIILSCLVASYMAGCSKKQPVTPPPPSSPIAYAAALLNNKANVAVIGDTITFIGGVSSTAGNNVAHKLWWEFGDGAKDSLISTKGLLIDTVRHAYLAAGTYSVTLLSDGATKSKPEIITICADPGHTQQMCSSRKWSGGKMKHNDTTTIALPDSAFAITFLDKVDVRLWEYQFVYSPQSSTTGMQEYLGPEGSYIRYYPVGDSVSLYYYKTGFASSGSFVPFSVIWYHTP